MKKNKSYFNIGIVIIIAIIFLVTAIVGPLVINILYKKNPDYITTTMWDANDMLAYFGVILGGVATIISLVITILYNNRQIRTEQTQQLNIILADYKKTNIEERYNHIFQNCKKIKSKILLEFLDDEKADFWSLLINHNKWFYNIMDLFNFSNSIEDLVSIEYSDEKVEREFLNVISDIRNKIAQVLRPMINELEQFNQNEIEKSNNFKISTDLSAYMNKSKEKKPTAQDIYNKYRKEILTCRDEYKPNFIKAYSELIKYKEQCRYKEIEALYKF